MTGVEELGINADWKLDRETVYENNLELYLIMRNFHFLVMDILRSEMSYGSLPASGLVISSLHIQYAARTTSLQSAEHTLVRKTARPPTAGALAILKVVEISTLD